MIYQWYWCVFDHGVDPLSGPSDSYMRAGPSKISALQIKAIPRGDGELQTNIERGKGKVLKAVAARLFDGKFNEESVKGYIAGL